MIQTELKKVTPIIVQPKIAPVTGNNCLNCTVIFINSVLLFFCLALVDAVRCGAMSDGGREAKMGLIGS